MKKYDFSLDGIPISVITEGLDTTVRRAVADTLCDGGYAVIVYPDETADFGVTCIDKNNLELREPHLALAALSCFFKKVRRFPDITLDLTYCGERHELIIDGERKSFTVNVGKCKFICAKTAKFPDGIELCADVVDCGYGCVSTLCYNCECFDAGRLRRLPTLLGMRHDTPAVAISYAEKLCVRTTGAIPFYDAVAVAVSMLVRSCVPVAYGPLVACVDDCEHEICYSSGRLSFYPNIKYLY